MYSAEDDKVLTSTKSKGSTWLEVLDVLGKKSKSQLQSVAGSWKGSADGSEGAEREGECSARLSSSEV